MELVQMTNDHSLVEKILNGDMQAFELFVERYKRLISHIVFRMVRNAEDREDICQEVFMKIYRNLGSFQFSSKLSTWVATIAYNHCANYLQKRKEPLFDDMVPEIEQVEKPHENGTLPDQKAEENDIAWRLQSEIGQLPGIYRIIITLYHLDEMSYNEIVKITGLPEGTVKSYLFRARKMLKDRLMTKYCQEDLCH